MKQASMLFIAFSILTFFSECTTYKQIVYLSPTNENVVKASDGFYEYKDSNVVVRYSFWASYGVMGFIVYNNTDKPIYIDWKKSSFIVNNKQLPYYEDKVTNKNISIGKIAGTTWLNVFNRNSANSVYLTKTISESTLIKEEQISFIAPHTYIAKAEYPLAYHTYYAYDKSNTVKDTLKRQNVYIKTPANGAIFRNYITYSSKENFEGAKSIDNEFRIKKIITLKRSEPIYRDQDDVNVNAWEKPTRYLIPKIAKGQFFSQPFNK